MSDKQPDSQRRLLMRASELAVALTKTLNVWGRPRLRLKIQGVLAEAWLRGYVQAVDDYKAHMNQTEVRREHDDRAC